MSPSAWITPVRKTIDEMWPSPVAQEAHHESDGPWRDPSRLIAGTIDGLKSATDSRAYSIVKQAPLLSLDSTGTAARVIS